MEQKLMYGIRHIPTGLYLPVPKDTKGCGRGGTFVEPADPWLNRIRLLSTEANAKRYLATWLNGKYYCHRYGSCDDYEEDVDIIPQPHRIKEDMEIVPIAMRKDAKGMSPVHVICDMTTGLYMPNYKESWNMRYEYSVECNQPDPANAFWFVKLLGAERYLKQWRKGIRIETSEFFAPKRVYVYTEIPERIEHDIQVLTYSFKLL
jgi:hypothetical protein